MQACGPHVNNSSCDVLYGDLIDLKAREAVIAGVQLMLRYIVSSSTNHGSGRYVRFDIPCYCELRLCRLCSHGSLDLQQLLE